MKDSLKYKIFITCLLALSINILQAQLTSDYHISKNFNCTTCNLKSATVNSFKTIRVNIHFISRSNGTGNFSETSNINDIITNENGYWLADIIINAANYNLANNEVMTQQLSYTPIPVGEINYNYKLNGVFFHRNDSFYECFHTPSSLTVNNGSAINVFIFAGRDGGAAYYDDCWIGGIEQAYSDYSINSNLWYINRKANIFNHEIGHLLSLDHPKRSPGGTKSTIGGIQYTDNCDDTPTFMELINDGYADPYQWCNGEYSNNIMDYSCHQRAFTPCQINQVHSYIETEFTGYQYGNFQNTNLQINNFSENMAYIAETVEIPSGASISIPNNKKLYIDAQELIINGEFEVPLGSTFEFKPFGM
jgi:hypothetical protein